MATSNQKLPNGETPLCMLPLRYSACQRLHSLDRVAITFGLDGDWAELTGYARQIGLDSDPAAM